MLRVALLPALAAALALPSPAGGALADDVRTARKGLEAAVEAGRLAPEEAAAHQAALTRAASLAPRLPPARARILAAVVDQVAGLASQYTGPRALTLFSMLGENADYLAAHAVPAGGRDVVGGDGTVYRMFARRGLQFHPLANAARLNGHLAAGREAEAGLLAHSLVRRAVPRSGGGAVWEYPFPYWNVEAPWASGMAQAVAAQALARAADRLGDPALLAAARAAFLAIEPALLIDVDGGAWIRLYERLGLVVLNAQLQAAVSLADYAELGADARAADLAGRLRATAAALLPRFDTGAWSRYSLGSESPLGYHRYVVTLLRRLARTTGEPVFAETAERFVRYEEEPPALRPGPAAPALYPLPRDGHRDTAAVRVWVSKISDVRLIVDGRTRRTVRARRGWNTISWTPPPTTRPGSLPVFVSAVGLAGNRAQLELPPLEVRRDAEPPAVAAAAEAGKLYWRVEDEGSARVRLRLVLMRGATRRLLDLGARPLRGALRPRLPAGRWWAVLEVADAAGNRARASLGRIA